MSAIVSKLEILGLRERSEVGVEGIEDEEKERVYVSSAPGKDSLKRVAERRGDCGVEVGALEPTEDIWWRGEAGRRRRSGRELPWNSWKEFELSLVLKAEWTRDSAGRGVMSSSWSSSMLPMSEMEEEGTCSSFAHENGLRARLGDRRGLLERALGSSEVGEEENAGDEWARVMTGAPRELELD